MEKIRSIDIMNDKKLTIRINIVAVILMIFFYIFFTGVTVFWPTGNFGQSYQLGNIIFGLLLLFALIVIHELIHGLFFKLFSPTGKVKFGFKNGMAYAASPGSKYTKGKFAWISAAPFVLITSCLTAAYLLGIMPAGAYILFAATHAGACVGDFYWCLLLVKAPPKTLVEDTEVGIDLYL
ncbi:DUF3267 domain-containing protein [Enterococcus sp. 669A]|uniref:DUF3267 domain-containing protein n=1 Tax=Candidatus Enterococcus moelleringii TaxID=2815325 RepID=A0ABS3LG29_9ENTE|nr:DUF3267 domain-containing protein [Enterococcus sp. 669A]MBO1308603.1 DUF3267 domain-containing protein [Enterococcus sp. 669A]